MRSGQEEGPPPQTGPARALEGRAEVEMGEDGRLTGLALDPAVLHMDGPTDADAAGESR